MSDLSAIRQFFVEEFPQSQAEILAVGNRSSTLRQPISASHLRPGGTVSALYAAILGDLGLVALAVTTNLNINFLRKPAADCAILAECRLIKVGRVLVVGEVFLYSEGVEAPVAHVTGTYSIPPER